MSEDLQDPALIEPPPRPPDWPEDRSWPPRGAHPVIPDSAYVEPGKPPDPVT